jgi:hypothetical protein
MAGRPPELRSPRLRIVLVDWQNLRLSLASARRRAGPAWVLRALADEVRRVLPDSGPETGTVLALFLTPAGEHRADRVLLEAEARAAPAVTVEVCCVDGDLVGIELALRAADAWHGHPDATVAVVSDAGRFAGVVRHYEDRPGRRPPWLLHLRERPPASRGHRPASEAARAPAASRRLRLRLDRPADVRGWNRWDAPAWALRQLAARTDALPARRSLRFDPALHGRDPWREADLRTGVRLDQLERIDNLVADLWRLDWGRPFDRHRAEAEAARRLGVEEAEAGAAVDALLVAQLLRWFDANRLEVPSSWREGLLLPMRRVVLRLARQPNLTYPLSKLVEQHRRRFLSLADAPAPDQRLHRRVEHESRVESWRWVRWALLEHLDTVEEQPDWRSRGALWTLTGSKFAADTVETAQRIRRRLAGPVGTGRLETELEQQEGIMRPSRWLRCLRDVGLVRRQGDGWAWEQGGELHLP